MKNLPSTAQIGVRLLEIANEIDAAVMGGFDIKSSVEEAIGLTVAGLQKMSDIVGLPPERQPTSAKNYERIVRMFNWEPSHAAETVRSIVRTYNW